MASELVGLMAGAQAAAVLTTLFTAITVVALGTAAPPMWVARRGYTETPWGRVIAQLAWVVGSLLIWSVVALLPLSLWVVGTIAAVTWGITTVGLDNPTYRGPLELTDAVRPSDLASLGRGISTRLEETRGTDAWLVIDDLIVLFMYCGDQRVFGFLRSIANRVRETDVKAIYGIDRRALSEETYNRLSVICDYRVELRLD